MGDPTTPETTSPLPSLQEAVGRLLFVVAIVTGLAWVVRGDLLPTHHRNREIDSEIEQVRGELASLEQEHTALRREIEALRHDPFYVEYLLRTRFGYHRPGEIVLPSPPHAR